MASEEKIRLDFICVRNAGRSQMAAAFAERERSERGLKEIVEVHSGGTEPADAVHEDVVAAMVEIGLDISDRSPKWVADLDQLEESDHLVLMGCSISKFNPEQYGVETHDWDLTNPDDQNMDVVRDVRDEIEARVETLFDDVERLAEERGESADTSGGILGTIRDSLSN